jgi:hypothetical protein
VAPEGDFIHFFAGDAQHLGDEFRRQAHDIGFAFIQINGHAGFDGAFLRSGKEARSAEKFALQRVFENLILQTIAPAGSRQGIGNAGHVFDAAAQNDIRYSRLDHGHTGNHGFHTGNANPVDGDPVNRVRNLRHQRRYSADIQGVMVLAAAAEPDIINNHRIDTGAPHGFFHGDAGNHGAVGILQCAAETPDGCAAGRNNYYILHRIHFYSPLSFSGLPSGLMFPSFAVRGGGDAHSIQGET